MLTVTAEAPGQERGSVIPVAPAPAAAAASEPAPRVAVARCERGSGNQRDRRPDPQLKDKAEKDVVMAEVEKLKAAKEAYEVAVGDVPGGSAAAVLEEEEEKEIE